MSDKRVDKKEKNRILYVLDMNKTEKTENEKSSYPQSSIREDLSSAESRSGSRDDEVHSGVDRANVKVKILQVAGYVWQTLQAVREKQDNCF